MYKEPFVFQADKPIVSKKLQKLCKKYPEFSFTYTKGEKCNGTLLDTFDSHLWKKGLLLIQEECRRGGRLLLFDLLSAACYEQSLPAFTADSKGYFFAAALSENGDENEIGKRLAQVSTLRAFLPLGESGAITFRFDKGLLLDDEEKTLVRLMQIVLTAENKGGKERRIVFAGTEYLRGYDEEYRLCAKLVQKCGGIPCRKEQSPSPALQLGLQKKEYSSRPTIPLRPKDSAKKNASLLLTSFITVARENEAGIIADIDTEFLHDYRVSLRKVRSVITLFKGVFAKEETELLKREFAELMKPTNTLRDLDVSLMQHPLYFSLTPANMHGALATLFTYFAAKREESFRQTAEILRSGEYKERIDALQRRFASGGRAIQSGKKAEEETLSFASRIILKRYQQVCRIAGSIDTETPDREVHKLRIVCKKLRYLMEFFTPLFPAAETRGLIRTLKKMQDTLGNFNDYSVQQEFLHRIVAEELDEFGEEKIAVAKAAGALTAMLGVLQQKEREKVEKNFQLFNSDTTRTSFQRLFGEAV